MDDAITALSTAVYNLPESVYRDLEMTNYGVAPFVPHFFPVIDSFAVVGKLEGSDAGFDLEFFTKDISPTRTVSFVKSSSEDLVERAATEVLFAKVNLCLEARESHIIIL